MIPKDVYASIHSLMPIACVDLVIEYEGKILLVRRWDEPLKDRWFIPGGHLQRDEVVTQAVKRIARTEVGLDLREEIKLVDYMDLFFTTDPFGHGKGTRTVSLVFKAAPRGEPSVCLDSHHSEFCWWDGMDERRLYGPLRDVLCRNFLPELCR